MLLEQAVKEGRERVGLPCGQPILPAQSLIRFWSNTVLESPDKPAFSCLGQTLSYGEVDQISRRIASYLQKELGLNAGDRIAIQLPNLIQYPAIAVAAWHIGLVVVNTNPMYSSRELIHQFNDAGVKVVFVLDKFYDTVREALPNTPIECVIVVRALDLLPAPKRILGGVLMRLTGRWAKIKAGDWIPFPDLLKSSCTFQAYSAKLDDICTLQYTGGTTGASKGVMLTNKSVLSNIAQCLTVLSSREKSLEYSCVIAPLPMYHIYSYALCLGIIPAIKGHSVLIPDPRNISAFIGSIKQYQFNIFTGLNSLFVALMEHPKFKHLDFSKLRITLSGGMALMESVAENWQKATGCVVSEGYGMTEASPVVSMNPLGFQKIGSAGMPIPGTEIKVIDEKGVEQEVGGEGELCVRGDQVMKGYWHCSEKTAETIVDGWLHTGDIVKIDEQGFIKVVDRLKDMIIVSGFNVYPNELEQALTVHPDVSQCAAIGVPDPKAGEVVKMFVVSANPELTEDQVIEYCKQTMAGYKVPKHVEFRDQLPMSNVGKVLRKDLRVEDAS
ncbi:MAG: AMP-binding protein [Porticoccaceae bacterium]|nr:AMP-binding protein [Porticoccaceae bacterium]